MRNPTEVEAEKSQSLMIKIQAWDELIGKQLVMGGKRAPLQLDSLVEFALLSCGLEESCSLHSLVKRSLISLSRSHKRAACDTHAWLLCDLNLQHLRRNLVSWS